MNVKIYWAHQGFPRGRPTWNMIRRLLEDPFKVCTHTLSFMFCWPYLSCGYINILWTRGILVEGQQRTLWFIVSVFIHFVILSIYSDKTDTPACAHEYNKFPLLPSILLLLLLQKYSLITIIHPNRLNHHHNSLLEPWEQDTTRVNQG